MKYIYTGFILLLLMFNLSLILQKTQYEEVVRRLKSQLLIKNKHLNELKINLDNHRTYEGETIFNLSYQDEIEKQGIGKLNSIIVVKENICETCKDNFLIEFDRLLDSLCILKNTTLLLTTEEGNGFASGFHKFFKERNIRIEEKSVEEIWHKDEVPLPKIIIILSDYDNKIVRCLEFQPNNHYFFASELKKMNAFYCRKILGESENEYQ